MTASVKEVLVVADPSQVGSSSQIFPNAIVSIVDQDAL